MKHILRFNGMYFVAAYSYKDLFGSYAGHPRDTLATPLGHPWDTFGTEYSCLLMEGCVSDVFRWKVCLFITVYQQYIHCNPVEYCT